jgi:hypothetical protein
MDGNLGLGDHRTGIHLGDRFVDHDAGMVYLASPRGLKGVPDDIHAGVLTGQRRV